MRTLGIVARPRPARDRLGRAPLPGARPRAADRRARRTRRPLPRRRRATSSCATSSLRPTRARASRRCATSTSTSRPGTTVALVGATGSGKTTLVQLLPRLYDVDRGRGARSTAPTCATSTSRSLRRAIAVVNDDPFLFSRHRRREHRLRAARRDAARRSSRPPGARRPHDFIARLPDGYDTRVGERGLTLSRRPAPADRDRARAASPTRGSSILDDATSSVDASTEQADQARAARGDGRAHDVRHRPPAVDDRAGRRDRRARGRPDRRARHATTSCSTQSELYREIVEKGLPDQVFLTRKPLEREVAGL